MPKILSVAVVLIFAICSQPAQAADPSASATLQSLNETALALADTGLELSRQLGLQVPSLVSLATTAISPQDLTLMPTGPFLLMTDFVVGRDALLFYRRNSDLGWRVIPSISLREEWSFLRRQVLGPDTTERLAEFFDLGEFQRPWSTTTTAHFLPSNSGRFLPFATVAAEVDSLDHFERIGVGAGLRILLQKNITLGAEAIYFGSDYTSSNQSFQREALFLGRLQIEF